MLPFRLLPVLLLVASAAQAQGMTYTVTQMPQPYVPLVGATPVSLARGATSTFAVSDEGYGTIPLGFSFPWYGQSVTSVGVTTNGLVLIGATANGQCNYTTANVQCTSGGKVPSTTRTPHSFIAPWWRDLDGKSAGVLRYAKPSPSEVVIEWSNWSYFSSTNIATFSYQVRLSSSGLVQVHYGTHSSGTAGTSISNGFENIDGTQGAPFLPCASAGASCTASNWPTDTLFTIGQPQQPDLVVQNVQVSNLSSGGADLQFDLSATLRNLGQTAAQGFSWTAYLSQDPSLDPSDLPIYTSPVPVSVAGVSAQTVSARVTVTPRPTTGRWYVLVVADSDNDVAEFSEANNEGAPMTPFYGGVELVAVSVSGPAVASAGDPITLQIAARNDGIEPASAVPVRVLLSNLPSPGARESTVFSTQINLAPGQQLSTPLSFTLPAQAPGGPQYWSVQLDPDGSIPQTTRTNDRAFASTVTDVRQADFQLESLAMLDPVLGGPTTTVFAGMPARVSAKIRNVGNASGGDVTLAVVISTDSSLSLLADTWVHEVRVPRIPAGTSAAREISFTAPTVDRNGRPFVGPWYVIAVVDSAGEVPEVNERDNWRALQVFARMPAPDLVVSRVQVSSPVPVGERIPIQRTLRNVGNAPALGVKYRYYASANDVISPSDVPLPIDDGPFGDGAGKVSLREGEGDSRTDLVRIPGWLTTGTWYIGCLVDPDGEVPELDEQNNFGSSGSIQVVAGAFQITTLQLPDAVVGMPFAFRLSTTAPHAQTRWDVISGALPPGLRLSEDGTVQGRATERGIYAFTVQASAPTGITAASLVIRALPAGTELTITSTALPPFVNVAYSVYQAQLSAAGGVAPYRWSLVSGKLPVGIVLSADGELSGQIRAGQVPTDGWAEFEVRDAVGGRARTALRVRLIPPGALVISTATLPLALVGNDYLTDLAAGDALGSSTDPRTLQWRLASGRLPTGIALRAISGRALLDGRPSEAGIFRFALEVADDAGHSDAVDLVLTVLPARYPLQAVDAPGSVEPGHEVRFLVRAVGAPDGVGYRINSGALPPGLTLSEAGTVSGTVDEDVADGAWTYTVEARLGQAVVGIGAFRLDVVHTVPDQGCSATGAAAAPGWLLLLAAFLTRWGRTARRSPPGSGRPCAR